MHHSDEALKNIANTMLIKCFSSSFSDFQSDKSFDKSTSSGRPNEINMALISLVNIIIFHRNTCAKRSSLDSCKMGYNREGAAFSLKSKIKGYILYYLNYKDYI